MAGELADEVWKVSELVALLGNQEVVDTGSFSLRERKGPVHIRRASTDYFVHKFEEPHLGPL